MRANFAWQGELTQLQEKREKDGSTDDMGWFTLDEVAKLQTSPFTPVAVGRDDAAGVGTPLAVRRG